MGFGDTHRACAIPLSPRCAFCALRVGGSIIVIIACDNIERLSKRGLEGGESAARGYIGVVVGVSGGSTSQCNLRVVGGVSNYLLLA